MDKKYDDMTKEEQETHDQQEREREQREQAALPYRWSQDLANVTVNVDLPKGTKGKDLNVVIEKRKLKVDLFHLPELRSLIGVLTRIRCRSRDPSLSSKASFSMTSLKTIHLGR